MSINSIQRQRKTKEYYESLLRKGIEPNNYEMNKLLTEHFDVNTPGMPEYSPVLQKPYEESSKEDYNHNFMGINEDLKTIYEADIEANNKAVSIQQGFDTEKSKISSMISKLQLRIDSLNESMKNSVNGEHYSQVFDDYYDIEFYGNAERNIPYTTSFIDLLQKKAYIEKTNIKSNKLIINDAKISLKGKLLFDKVKEEGDIKKILTDTYNDMYILKAKSISEDTKEIELIIELNREEIFSSVSFDFTSVKDIDTILSISEDGKNYIPAYTNHGKGLCEWRFSPKKAKYIKITIIKKESDGITDNGSGRVLYDYIYILKNISVTNDAHESKSVLVTKPIAFNGLYNSIKLDVNENIFNNTRIDYFIGFDNGKDKIGWDAIENHKDHKLFMFEKTHRIVNRHIEDSFGEKGDELNLYKIYKLPNGVNRNSIRLTAGYNMWSVIKYDHKNGNNIENGFNMESGDFSEYINECYARQMFMDCENYDKFTIKTNTLYVFTQYIDMKSQESIHERFIKIIMDLHGSVNDTEELKPGIITVPSQIKVFVNGYEVMLSSDNMFSAVLKKGVNKVQIAIYCPYKTIEDWTLYNNINFKTLTNNCFAFTPMKYTSNMVLERNPDSAYRYYTIKDGVIYVRNNPDDMIKSQINDMGYFLTYYSLKKNLEYYFDKDKLKFRIMAVLTSKDKNITPEIINFRITGR